MGAALIVFALFGAAVGLPRATTPYVVPIPKHDPRTVREADAIERLRAEEAVANELPYGVRLVGERVRRLGAALVDQPSRAPQIERQLQADVQSQLKAGQAENLLRLRALQSELFLNAVRHWQKTGEVDSELRELGSDFDRIAQTSWLAGEHSDDRRLVLGASDLRLLFRVRWGLLTGVHRTPPFGPSLNEFRRYYGLLIAHPEGGLQADARDRAQRQLAYVGALGKIDPNYPTSFARGAALLLMQEPESAAKAFEQHLEQHPNGPWTLLARNHLIAARSILPSP